MRLRRILAVRALLFVCLLAAALLVATACGGGGEEAGETPAAGETPGATAAAGQPRMGGTITSAFDTEVLTLDPHMSTVPYTVWVVNLATNGVLQYDRDGNVAADLAESWKYNTDTELILNLRKGVKWQNIAPVNGREFTADDAVYSLTRLGTQDPKFAHRALMESVDKIEAMDKYTVKITLKTPNAYFLNCLANPYALMVPKEYVDSMPSGELTKGVIGTGPFILKEHNKSVGSKLVRNPDYWGKDEYGNQLPYLDGTDIVVMPDATARKAAFKSGKVASYLSTSGTSEVDEMKRDVPGVQVTKYLYGGNRYLAVDVARKPFDDVRVRQAVAYATDVNEYIRIVAQDEGEPIVGAVPPSLGKWALPKEELHQYDLEKAKQLLAEAGYPDGFKTTTETVAGMASLIDVQSQIMQSQLKKIGVDVSVKVVPWGEWVSHAYKKQFDIYTILDEPGTTPDDYLYPRFHTGGKKNTIDYSNPRVDELLDKQRVTLDDAERLKIVQEVQRLIEADQPQVNLFQVYYFSMSQPNVRNSSAALFGLTGSTANLTQYVWLEK